MKARSFMLIAGEASGDLLAAELARALRREFMDAAAVPTPDYQPLHTSLEPRFFGAGGPKMASAGVELAFDLTEHSVIGFSDALKNYLKFRRLFRRLFQLALEREPDAIICVDFGFFNLRFAHAIRQHVRSRSGWFHNWHPKLIQYVSPQVWASREGRAHEIARDYDLLLCTFGFEKEWYAQRVPNLRVEFVGHPILERYEVPGPSPHPNPLPSDGRGRQVAAGPHTGPLPSDGRARTVLLLPGSRSGELRRHLPVMTGAWAILRSKIPSLRGRMVLPNETLVNQTRTFGLPADLEVQAGGLPEALMEAEVAIASTGTVTLECAFFGVPTVALYRTSWSTYQIGKQIVKVKYLAMPNLLANEEIFPEFIQHAATPENIARATFELLNSPERQLSIKRKLGEIVGGLGGPGASHRAARAILQQKAAQM
jgi:lipid-A-disaccharide synthase